MTLSIFWMSHNFWAWTFVRGKPSSKMLFPSSTFSSSTIHFTICSSGISFPELMNFWASRPRGVFSSIWCLRTSPVDTWNILKFFKILSEIVPFPLPGAPLIYLILISTKRFIKLFLPIIKPRKTRAALEDISRR